MMRNTGKPPFGTLQSRAFFSFIFCLLLIAAPLCSGADLTRFAFLPLTQKSADSDSAWIGRGLILRLQEELQRDEEDIAFADPERIRESIRILHIDLEEDLDYHSARRLSRAVDADILLWGEYEVAGSYLRTEISVRLAHREVIDTFKVAEPLDDFDQLVQRVFEELYRLRQKKVPLEVRRRWQDESGSGRGYGDFVRGADSRLSAEERIPALKRYLEDHPDHRRAGTLLMDLLYEQGKKERALEAGLRLLERHPESDRVRSNVAFLLAGQDRSDEARMHYEAAVEQAAEHPEIYFNYGNLLHRLGLRTQALKIYRKGVNLFPEDEALQFNLGLLYKELHRTAEEQECLRKLEKAGAEGVREGFKRGIYLEDRWIYPEDKEMEP
jgi:tetratricopeptide (TPR) repeat protein